MLFRPDGKLTQVMNIVADLLVINLLTLVCSVPVVTMGAALTAAYSSVFRLKEDRDGYLVKEYFKAFKSNFKQATGMWMGFLFIAIMYVLDFILLKNMESSIQIMQIMVLAMGIVLYAVFSYAFPLQAYFVNPVKKTISNSIVLASGRLPSTVMIMLINLAPFILIMLAPQFMTGVYVVLGVSAPMWFSSHFLLKIFSNIKIVDKDGNEVLRKDLEED